MSDRPGYRGKPAQVSVATGPAHLFVGRRSFLGHCRADDRASSRFTAASVFLISSWRLSSPPWPCALTSTLQLRVWSFRHWRSDDEERGHVDQSSSTPRQCV